MKKLRKNKLVVLAICVIVISFVYWGAQKAIDEYIFKDAEVIEFDDSANEEIKQNDVEIKGEDESELKDGAADGEEAEMERREEGATDGEEAEMERGEEGRTEGLRKIYVYVTGEVNLPGVIMLNEGSRIVDAINAAGGTTSNANISKINLVYVLEDGMKVNIPNYDDLEKTQSFEYITIDSGDGANDSSVNDNESISKGNSHSSIVNINTATQTELETLPGIGPSIALKIINYRKENGKFSSIEDIKNVSGIGNNKFENIKKYITI